MKVMFLNAWGASAYGPLSEFITHHTPSTDVFCFQEADRKMPNLCKALLHNYHGITARKFVTDKDNFCQTIYVRKDIAVLSHGTILEHQKNVGLGLYAQIKTETEELYICNFHGVSRPVDKHDTPARLQQSQGLVEFLETIQGPKIIGGDFNVFPSNYSIQLFQRDGYQDLIKDYGITNTRNRLVWDRYPKNEKQYYSDYVFASKDLHIDAFVVPNIEVSDHLPMIVDVSLVPDINAYPAQDAQIYA